MELEAMDHDQFRQARHALGLSVEQMAAMLGCSGQHVRRLEIAPGVESHRPVNGTVERLMRAYAEGYRPADWPVPAGRKRI